MKFNNASKVVERNKLIKTKEGENNKDKINFILQKVTKQPNHFYMIKVCSLG